MASTNTLVVFILLLVFFNTIVGMFALSDSSKNFSLTDYMFISKIRASLEQNKNWVSDIIKVILTPFLIIDGIIGLLTLLGIGFAVIPPIINVLIWTPITLIVTFEYIIPVIRGN